jgi:phosphocarrier protein
MYAKTTKVINRTGLHARPASDFVIMAKTFASKVSLRNLTSGGEAVNAKSIARLLASGISMGSEIEITAEGEDERQAVDGLIALVESGFGE